jgi:hypothetical protein
MDELPELVVAMRELGLDGEASPFGRWIRIRDENGPIYVSRAAFGRGYYTWDDAGNRRRAGPYDDPLEAIRVGLWRAQRPQAVRPTPEQILQSLSANGRPDHDHLVSGRRPPTWSASG